MKLILATAMLALTLPASAQTPKLTAIPDTALSTAPVPSTGPRSREADLPSNSATSANSSTLAVSPQTSMPVQALDNYPICKLGEFDHCMEPGNGPAIRRRLRRPS